MFPNQHFELFQGMRVLRVRELLYCSGLAGNGSYLSPDIVAFYKVFEELCDDTEAPDEIGNRIYLSRRSYPRRILHNESEIEDTLRSIGFSIIDPADYSYKEQVAIFRKARTIVSPHGAGLTNLLFCEPGTRVLELFADCYINLGLQRLANLKQARYAYLVGHSKKHPEAMNEHDFTYQIPIEDLRATIHSMES
jgi:capsular polysaccharide biosynthesis protein